MTWLVVERANEIEMHIHKKKKVSRPESECKRAIGERYGTMNHGKRERITLTSSFTECIARY